MAIAKDEPSVGKADARSGQWVDITMKKVHRLLSMTDSDDRKHVLDYTHVDLIYVEDQRKNMVNKYNLLKQELSLHKSELSNLKNIVSINCSFQNEVIRVNLENESLKDEISDLKRVIEKWTCSKVTLDQLLSEQIHGNIVKALGGKGRRKENNPSKEVLFTKADEPLPPLPKLTGADPSGASKNLKSSNKVLQTYVIKKKTESKHPAVQKSELRNEMQATMSNQTNELKNMMTSFFQMNTASSSGSGPLPSNTIANPKGELKAITTRSGIVLDGLSVPMPHPFINPEEKERVEETLTDSELVEYTIKVPPPLVQISQAPSQKSFEMPKRDPLHPNIPYPSRINKEKQQDKDERDQ
ncbi:hypothetical protein Tco_0588060 [Tanacetum coccineum]